MEFSQVSRRWCEAAPARSSNMYDSSDPRSTLAPAASDAAAKAAPTHFAAADIGKFYQSTPQEDDVNGKSWFIRSQHAVIVYTEAPDGARFVRKAQADEYVLLLPDTSASATVTTPAGKTTV